MGSKVDKLFNKVADKIVPKELAPFLPALSMFIPGAGILGSSVMSNYLLPQLLTGLSSAKMTGEVDPKQQALTLATSLLGSGDLKGQTAKEKAFLEQNPDLLDRSSKEALRQAKLDTAELINDPSAYYEQLQKLNNLEQAPLQDNTFFGGLKDRLLPDDLFGMGFTGQDVEGSMFARDPKQFYKFDDGSLFAKDTKNLFGDDVFLNKYLDKMPTPEDYKPFVSTDATGADFKKFFTTGDKALSEEAFKKRFDTAGKGLTTSQKSGDFLQGVANKGTDFMKAPIGFNMPTVTRAGIAASPFFAAEASNYKRKLEEEEEAAAAQQQSYADAISQLGTYYSRLADPTRRFGEYEFAANGGLMGTRAGYNMGGMGSIPQTPMVPQGMQLDGRGGGFIPMGAQEKRDDVPAMLAKNEFVMTSDAVKAAGGGSIEKGAQKMYDLMNQLEAQV
tara:strand:- start:68 stop:1405 length:1338 start_codon:yes stop_codon:yes gene_type:complete